MNKRFRKQKGQSTMDKVEIQATLNKAETQATLNKVETQATLDSKTQNEDIKNNKNKRINKMRKDSKIIILNSIVK